MSEIERDAIIYDCEIRNCIPERYSDSNAQALSPFKMCQGWSDYVGMGIAVICAIDCFDLSAHVYLGDNFQEFAALAARREYVIGYNSRSFDDLLCAAHGVQVKTTYDLYDEVKLAAGHKPGKRVSGYKLAQIAGKNLPQAKSMTGGAQAPVLWQTRRYGELIEYCLKDVYLVLQLLQLGRELVDPNTNQVIRLRNCFEAKNNGEQATLRLD